MTNTGPAIKRPSSSALEPISIRTDLPQSSRYVDTMASDIPELSHDRDHATPHSATSSNMIPTPVYDWKMPLGEDFVDCKSVHLLPTLEDWPPSVEGLFPNSFSSPPQSQLSSPSVAQESSLDPLDELDWEKPTFNPDLSPTFSTTSSYSMEDLTHSPQRPISLLKHVYPSSANTDTPCNQYIRFSPAQASTTNLLASTSNTVSPSVLSSASSSTTSSPIRHTQAPLKLHQPRPSRRIPIISLDELASASEGVLQPVRRRKYSKPSHYSGPYPRSPVEALSPLPLDCHGFSPVSEKREFGHLSTSKISSYQPSRPPPISNPSLSALFRSGGLPTKVITCSCGCMESYTIQ